jgi:hypothetical protein
MSGQQQHNTLPVPAPWQGENTGDPASVSLVERQKIAVFKALLKAGLPCGAGARLS